MNEKDKIILKDSALIAADGIVSSIPGLNIAWDLSKAFFGAGLKLRYNRALKWVEMVRDHPEIFTKQVLNDEIFQDGFVFMLENYIRERSEEKRKIAQKIFLGFVKSDDKSFFSMEKFAHTLTQISDKDLTVMRDIDIKRASLEFDDQGREMHKDLNYQIYGNTRKDRESIYNLINLGVLLDETGSRFGPVNDPFVSLSIFGQEFIKFIVSSGDNI